MKNKTIDFEVRCPTCGFFELWGLERAIRALTTSGKLSPDSEFDADLFAELFLVHAKSVPCPTCRKTNSLVVKRAAANAWIWDDVVRCEDCGREIPEARLRAVPGATRCVDCQNDFDGRY